MFLGDTIGKMDWMRAEHLYRAFSTDGFAGVAAAADSSYQYGGKASSPSCSEGITRLIRNSSVRFLDVLHSD